MKKTKEEPKRKKCKPIEEPKRKKYKAISDYSLGWGIQPVPRKDGGIIYYLNKFWKGRTQSHLILNLKELKNLKRFMKERKF